MKLELRYFVSMYIVNSDPIFSGVLINNRAINILVDFTKIYMIEKAIQIVLYALFNSL